MSTGLTTAQPVPPPPGGESSPNRHEITRRALGEGHPDMAQNPNNLAESQPAQHTLTGIDAQQGEALEKQVDEMMRAGKFAETLAPAREVAALRARVQGTGHWQAADAARRVRTLMQVTTLPAGDRAEFASAIKLTVDVIQLMQQRRYAAAEPLHRRALGIHRRILGDDHPLTAICYNNLAINLDEQGRHAEAELLLRQALEIHRRVLGDDHPLTANSYDSLADHLSKRGQYAEAEPLHRRALAICRRVLGEDHPLTAICYNNLAGNLGARGRHAEAEPLLRTALESRRRTLGENHPDTAATYANLAANLGAQGKHVAAEPLLRTALEIRRRARGEDHPDTAASYNNLAANLQAQGKYADAEPLLRTALETRRRALGEGHPDTAASYNNLAANLAAQGKYADAEPLLRTALETRRRMLGEDHPDTAASYNGLAMVLQVQGKYADAEPLLRTALAIRRRALGEGHPDTAQGYNNLAVTLVFQGKYAEAEPLLRTALETFRRALGEDHPGTAEGYTNLALILDAQGRYTEAEALLIRAAGSFEHARLAISSTGLDRAAFAAEHSPLLLLAALQARRGQPTEAWARFEAHLARGLLDDLSARRGRPLDDQERRHEQDLLGRLRHLDKQLATLAPGPLRDRLGRDRDAILTKLTALEHDLVAKYGPAAGQTYDLTTIQAHLPPDVALVAWLDLVAWVDLGALPQAAEPSGAHWACLVRSHGQPAWVALTGTGPDRAWTAADVLLPIQVYATLALEPADPAAPWRDLTARLAAQRLGPLRPGLLGNDGRPPVRHLIVLPSPALADVPVEALVAAWADRPHPLTVSYAPSGTLLAWLQQRRPLAGRRIAPHRLLALGDPVFPQPNETGPLPPPPPEHGLLVLGVLPGSHAAAAGLRPGDVLLRYAGTRLGTSTRDEFRTALLQPASGDRPLTVWREGRTLELTVPPGLLGVNLDNQPAPVALIARRAADEVLRRTRGPAPTPLPGSRAEVEAIARLFNRPTLLLGSDASEQQLDALVAADALRRFDVLHLATHGVLDDRVALHSALLLARDRLPADPAARVLAGQEAYDGTLTAEQILRTWKLDAELVTLSACQSALGRPGGGEGYLGFSQALFLAGARSLVLSLWKVDDQATQLLMTRFYQNLLGRRAGLDGPLPKAEALREAKEWLRGLTVVEAARLT
ncbi:MAG TPA: tetratricopeptide repeat protein, partial [Streptosporangiaceae bacterium]|nr:tetratricopeptide repeat protein [Streptosporangiaceae bacterium]